LAYNLEILNGNRQTRKLNLTYIHPTYSIKRLYRKLRKCEKSHNIKSVCIQSLDMFSSEEEKNIFGCLGRIMGLPESF
jgi:hypothetical protein